MENVRSIDGGTISLAAPGEDLVGQIGLAPVDDSGILDCSLQCQKSGVLSGRAATWTLNGCAEQRP
jgi:hypothetical protein